MSERVLFLDIDGVMMPFAGHNPMTMDTFTPDAVRAVLAMQAEGWRLILHSTWRQHPHSLAEAEQHFADNSIPLSGCVDVNEPSKARAIVGWLDEHYGETWPQVCVVDDDPIELSSVCVIRPDFRVGVRLSDFEHVRNSAPPLRGPGEKVV